MAFAVDPGIVLPFDLGALIRWNDRLTAALVQVGDERRSGIARSAMTCGKVNPLSNASAWVLSWRWRGVKMTRKGLPKPSTVRWILQLKPPRLRPSACAPCFFAHLRHRDGRAQLWRQSSRVRYRGQRPTQRAGVPTPPLRTSAQTTCTPYSTRHTRRAASAIARHCGSSTSPPPRSGGTPAHLGRCRPATPGARTGGSWFSRRRSIECRSCLLF